MLEKDIQAKVVVYARGKGVMCKKMSFGEGWPDYLFLYGGRALFIEFKSPGSGPTPLQRYVHGLLARVGFDVPIVDNVVNGKRLIDRFIGN